VKQANDDTAALPSSYVATFVDLVRGVPDRIHRMRYVLAVRHRRHADLPLLVHDRVGVQVRVGAVR
jgi:hypothetical protein